MISRSRRFRSVKSIFSYTFDRTVSIMTLHSPSLVSQMSVKLLIPWHHLYTSNGGGSVLACALKAKNEQIKNETVVLEDECRGLETTN